ncbi:MAG: hypothetical protein WEC73_01705 [Chthoniobacterales bacterium]
MIKKLITLLTATALVAPAVFAQIETGTDAGQMALDRARSAPISAGGPTTDVTVTVSDGKTLGKEVVIIEEDEKWWSVNFSTGWDSLYMFRGVNVLGNGNSLYWLGGDVSVSPWDGGSLTAGVWYGVGLGRTYSELDVFVDFTQSFGALDASFGWVLYYYPDNFGAGGPDIYQNELYWALAYNIEVGSISFTPSATYYLNVGPDSNSSSGWTKPGASYLLFQLDSSIPVTDWLAIEPWTAFGVNFDFNNKDNGDYFQGGNNWELGLSVPIQITEWFGIAGYVAYSYQWQDLVGTDENTWWAGASANFSF